MVPKNEVWRLQSACFRHIKECTHCRTMEKFLQEGRVKKIDGKPFYCRTYNTLYRAWKIAYDKQHNIK